MKVTLHDYWRSSASYRVRIALGLKGISYDRVPVDLVAGENKALQYLAIHPQGLVPALEIDGQLLTQSLAIIEYLEETYPEPPLLPKIGGARSRVRAMALAIACEIHPISNTSVLKRIEDLAGAEAREKWNYDNIASGLAAFEKMLDHPCFYGNFCHGDKPGMADCVLIPQLYNATRWGVAYDHLSRISAVAANCREVEGFADAHPDKFKP